MTMNALPDVIYHEILLYIPYVDHISFSMVDKVRCNLLLKRVRRIKVYKKAQLYFTSQEFRDKINSLIVDPYNQLSLVLNDIKDKKNFKAFSCSELYGLNARQLRESFLPDLRKVRCLDIYSDFSQDDCPSKEIDWINSNPSLSLKELEFTYITMLTDFPLIDQVESLKFRGCSNLQNIPLHHITPNLRSVVLHDCDRIEDVSSLDKIHELHLICCQGIRDISCLNHNHKVLIEECNQITDYSNSFRHTKTIELFRMKEISLDFSNLLELKELIIIASRITGLIFPHAILSLRRVYMSGLDFPFTIPSGNRIKQLTILNCPKFTSLLNCDRIHSVKLFNLKISALEGLGSGNRIVEITSCPSVKDFSVLRTCDKVIIERCSGLRDLRPLRSLKDFSFSSSDNLPKDLEGVTNLTIPKIPKTPYYFPKSVTQLKLSLFSNSVSEFPCFLANLPPQINEVKIGPVNLNDIEDFRSFLNDLPQFSFETYRENIQATTQVYFRRNVK